jgi:hypothetical protein
MNQKEMDAEPFEKAFPLSRPIKTGDGEITEIILREPTRAQLKAVRAQPADKQEDHALFTCAGVLPEVIDKLQSRDWHRLSDWLAPFFQGPTPTP